MLASFSFIAPSTGGGSTGNRDVAAGSGPNRSVGRLGEWTVTIPTKTWP